MDRSPTKWEWRKVPHLHPPGPDACPGALRVHTYRLHPPGSSSYPRCASLIWCSLCRDFTTYLVRVDAEESLVDPLAALDPEEQDRIRRGEYRLVAYLDRLNPPGG